MTRLPVQSRVKKTKTRHLYWAFTVDLAAGGNTQKKQCLRHKVSERWRRGGDETVIFFLSGDLRLNRVYLAMPV